MASKHSRRINKDANIPQSMDKEDLAHRLRLLESEKQGLSQEETKLQKSLQEAEAELVELSGRVKQLRWGGGDSPSSAVSQSQGGATSLVLQQQQQQQEPLRGQELELELGLLTKSMKSMESTYAKEASQWQARAVEAREEAQRLEKKLSTYPKRFMQTIQEAKEELRALEEEREVLEGEAKGERERLYQELQKARTRLGLAEMDLEAPEKEMMEVEGDRVFWQAKLTSERAKVETVERTWMYVLSRIQPMEGGRGVERAAFERINAAVVNLSSHHHYQEDVAGGYAEVVADLVGPFVGVDVYLTEETVEEAMRGVLGGGGEVPRNFDEFCTLFHALCSPLDDDDAGEAGGVGRYDDEIDEGQEEYGDGGKEEDERPYAV